MSKPTVASWFVSMREQAPNAELGQAFDALLTQYNSRLWHQLGEGLLAITREDFMKSEKRILDLYNIVVSVCAHNLDPLVLAQLSTSIADQYDSPSEAIEFLKKIAKDVAKHDAQALIIANAAQVPRYLEMKDEALAEAALDECSQDVSAFSGTLENACSSAFHKAAYTLNKAKGNATEYFQHAMLYLLYTPLTTLSSSDKLDLAADVGLAALIGEKLYNIGELLQHRVVSALVGSKHEWIVTLLGIFNNGDIAAFESAFPALAKEHVELAQNASLLHEKIRIMRLLVTVFSRQNNDHSFTFDEIQAACNVPADQVELLVLRAFSVGVLKGEINEVKRTVEITWVLPRVLDKAMLTSMRDRLSAWRVSTKKTVEYVDERSKELLVGKFGSA